MYGQDENEWDVEVCEGVALEWRFSDKLCLVMKLNPLNSSIINEENIVKISLKH